MKQNEIKKTKEKKEVSLESLNSKLDSVIRINAQLVEGMSKLVDLFSISNTKLNSIPNYTQ